MPITGKSQSRNSYIQDHLMLIYDAQCVLCTNSVARLQRMHSIARIEYVSIQEMKPEQLPAELTQEQLLSQIHVIDVSTGHIYQGADGVVQIMSTVSSLQWLARAYRVPGLHGLAKGMYRFIAKHRYQLFGKLDHCESGSCRISQHK